MLMENSAPPSSAFLNEFQDWLDSFLNFEKLPQKNMFWLDTMETLAGEAGHPELSCPSFHVAGSKGKGSTSAFISSILSESGMKTGLYTSPHILSFFERITRNRSFLPENVYEESAKELMALAESGDVSAGGRPVTWFELVTMYAFLCFRRAKMDAAVFEVGLGGRLDATNIVRPLVSCITAIEKEHTEYLGDTLEKIAAEKGGIIKEETPVIVSPQPQGVRDVFRRIAREKQARIGFADELCTQIESKIRAFSPEEPSGWGMDTRIVSPLFSRPLCARLLLAGDFQAVNAAVAALAVRAAFPAISEDTIERGLERTTLPARFEIVRGKGRWEDIPYIVIDGAHTPRSIGFTLGTAREAGMETRTLLFACAKDKDVRGIASLLKGKFDKVFLTVPGGVKKGDLADEREAFASNGIECTSGMDYKKLIEEALCFCAREKSPLLVTGSFYLAAEVKRILQG